MKKIIFYSYQRCSTCRKASNWLDQNKINYLFVDIIKNPPSKEFLELAINQFSLDIKKIFNTRGKSFKSIDFDIFKLAKHEIVELLSNNGSLIKRPFLIINESKLILGFNDAEYSAKLK